MSRLSMSLDTELARHHGMVASATPAAMIATGKVAACTRAPSFTVSAVMRPKSVSRRPMTLNAALTIQSTFIISSAVILISNVPPPCEHAHSSRVVRPAHTSQTTRVYPSPGSPITSIDSILL